MRSHRIAALSIGVVLSLVSSGVGARGARADSNDEQRNVQQIADQIDRLQAQADQLAEEYSQALADKAQLDTEVVVAQGKVSEQEAQLGQLRVSLGEVAVRSYTTGGAGGLGPLFSSPDSYTEGLERGQLAKVALNVGAQTGDELQALIDGLDADRKDLERKRQRAENLTKVIDDKRTKAEAYGTQLDQAYRDATAKYQDALEQEQARRAADSLRKLQQEQAAAKAKADAAAVAAAAALARSSSSPGSVPKAVNPPSTGGRGGGVGSDPPPSDAGGSNAPAVDPSPPPPSSKAQLAVEAAQNQLGVPYRFAASSPGVAFDCSGLTSYAWGRAGVYLPHQSAQQYGVLAHVAETDAQPGDLIFSHTPISHVSIYIGNGLMIHAPRSGDVVKVAAVNWGNVVGVGRPG